MQRLLQRTLGFSRIAYRVTKEPVWQLVSLLGHHGDDVQDVVVRRCGISPEEWTHWSPIVFSPTLERALSSHHDYPSWVVLALAAHKVRSPNDAQSILYDLALPLTSCHAFPLLILTAHSLAHFSLVALLRPLTSHVLDLPQNSQAFKSFHFNMLLQAISLFDRSRTAADVAVELLKEMENRGLILWSNTERVLIKDNFRSPQLLDYFRSRCPANLSQSGAWLRAHASLGRVQSSAYYLHTIRKQCLENGFSPPYTTEDMDGTAHKANTHYLRSMRDDRQSAFKYFHHLLKLDLHNSRQSRHPESKKIDIYDWTTALYAGTYDRSLSANSLLDLFRATKEGTSAYRPTRATYTVVIQGLLWKNALEDAEKLWDEFVSEVAAGQAGNQMRIDRKALCVGIDVLVRSGRAEEALYLLDEAVKKDMEDLTTESSSSSKASLYLKVHPIHALFTALLHIRRPDAIFYIWSHLTSLYAVPPTNLMLRILLKAAMQAAKMDAESLKGAMSWYMADNRLFKKQDSSIARTTTQDSESRDPESMEQRPCRESLATHLRALFQTPPLVAGIWANRRSTEVARSIFRGMMFGNWPSLHRSAGPFAGGVTSARAKGSDSVLQELARVFTSHPGHFLPPVPTYLGTERPKMARSDERLGPPLPTVIPSESTFATYISLLGLSSRAEEIPEVLVWMQALGVVPKTETLSVALVFWMEIGLRGPVFEDGWMVGSESLNPRTEYGALRMWIRDWVGQKAPTEEDIYAGIKRVREMRG